MSTQPSPPLSPPLLAVMRRQGGLCTADQAYAAGYSPGEVKALRSTGTLHSVRRGVYAVTGDYAALDRTGRHRADAQAALLRLTAPVTLSHETAAVWSTLPLLRPSLATVHVTRPELRVSRCEAGIHQHPGALPPDQVAVVDGVTVTSPARTAVDIARRTDFARALAAVDSCLRAGTSREQLQEVMDFARSWPGARGASRAVSAGDGRAANPGESWSRAVLIEVGVPPSDLQYEVRDGDGLVGFADFVWEEQQTLGEFDGQLKYLVPAGAGPEHAAAVLWAEKRREDRFRARDFQVVRWGWEDLFHPQRLLARVLAAFARAGTGWRTAG